ncbi:MAG: hypothetical protein IJG80_07115 [Selenomonadaceae bacterium]|nr:hypothetical protein [Selenomonadaceae bacterium]
MTLDTVAVRHELINDLINRTAEYEEILSENEDDLDLGAAKVTRDDLINIERLICTEEIFLETLGKLKETPHSDGDEKAELLKIFSDKGANFLAGLLLERLEYLLNTLNTWGIRTEVGKEFHEYMRANLEALIAKYTDYDAAAQEIDITKLDTNLDRLKVVIELYDRAKKIDDNFKAGGQPSFGDVLGLMVMMEKLMALRELLRTEKIFENALEGVYKVEGVNDEPMKEISLIVRGQNRVFAKLVLIGRLRSMINFAENKFDDERLMEFQKDFRGAMKDLLKYYSEAYDL